MKNYPRTFYLVPEIALSKKCGYLRIKCFGLEIGYSRPSVFGDIWCCDIGLFGYGKEISFRPLALRHYVECYNDFWAANLKDLGY